MWWSPPTLPVTPKDKAWVEQSFLWLREQFGEEYTRSVVMLLPEPRYFPEPFHGSPQCARALLERVCTYMQVNPATVQLAIYDEHVDELKESVPQLSMSHSGAAGLYLQPQAPGERHVVGIETRQLTDPFTLVATLAHEIGHVKLLGEERLARDQYHELLTDLCTVFCGFGIFSANSARTFQQYQRGDGYHGWRYGHHGYLSQQVYGYALACWAYIRNERKPAWARALTVNVKSDFHASLKYLQRTGDTSLRRYAG